MTKTKEGRPVGSLDRKSQVSQMESHLEALRQALGNLVVQLRDLVRKQMADPPARTMHPNARDCQRILGHINKAYTRGKEAEALFETLISRVACGEF